MLGTPPGGANRVSRDNARVTTRRRRRTPRSPLPQRHGLDAARLRTPAEGDWPTMRAHLVDRLTRVSPTRIDELLAAGEIVGTDGPVAPDAPFVPNTTLWVHRDLPDETPVPFTIDVLHRDDDVVVVDKPHFLATIPRGSHIRETVLVRLREELGLPELGVAAPPGPRHGRAVAAGRAAGTARGVPVAVREGTGRQDLRGDRAVRAVAGAAAHRALADRQAPRDRAGPHGAGAGERAVPWSSSRRAATGWPATRCVPAPVAHTSCGCT